VRQAGASNLANYHDVPLPLFFGRTKPDPRGYSAVTFRRSVREVPEVKFRSR
jgi:hypothetical protein